MDVDLLDRQWFADATTTTDFPLPSTEVTLAYSAVTLTAKATMHDCPAHAAVRITRQTQAQEQAYGAAAVEAARAYLMRLFDPGLSLAPHDALAVPGCLAVLRRAVAGIYAELDGNTAVLRLP